MYFKSVLLLTVITVCNCQVNVFPWFQSPDFFAQFQGPAFAPEYIPPDFSQNFDESQPDQNFVSLYVSSVSDPEKTQAKFMSNRNGLVEEKTYNWPNKNDLPAQDPNAQGGQYISVSSSSVQQASNIDGVQAASGYIDTMTNVNGNIKRKSYKF